MRLWSALALGLALLTGPSAADERAPQVYSLPAGAAPQQLAAESETVLWFSSRNLGALGRLDTASGEAELVSLGQGAKPAALVQGSNAKLFAVDAAANTIHELDQGSREHARHVVPSETGLLELSSAALDGMGRVWFTGYAGVYGRLDPATGQVAVWPAPGGRGPMALAGGRDRLWYASYANSSIASIDPDGARVETVPLPAGHEGPKSLAIDARGQVWVTAYRTGALLRYDPALKAWSAWAVPGREPKPYAVALDGDGAVWLTDPSEARVLRFDPKAGTFQAVAPIASRGLARGLLEAGGRIFVAESGADQILGLTPPEMGAQGPGQGLVARKP